MTRDDRSFEQLQARWAAGETLSPEEDAQRLQLASQDIGARRELQVSRQLKQYLSAGEPAEPGFVDAVLARAAERGTHLRLVRRQNEPAVNERATPEESWSLRGNRRWRRVVGLAGLAALTGLALGAFVWFGLGSQQPLASKPPVAPQSSRVLPTTPARSELVFMSGEVSSDQGRPSLGQRTLSRGARLTTARGQACFSVEPAIDVCLARDSAVVLEALQEHDVRVRVQRGRVVAALGPRRPGHSFALTDGEVSAVARGTVFALTKDAKRRATRVTVVEGSVEVSRAGLRPTLVREHSELEIAGDRVREPSVVSRSYEAQFLSLVAVRELWRPSELGIVSVAQAGETKLEVELSGHGPFELPVTTFAPVGQQRVIVRDDQHSESLVDVQVRPGETSEVTAGVPVAAADPPQRPALAEQKSPSELLAEARAAARRNDTEAQLAAYRRLMTLHPQSPEASTILVTVGKLELKHNSPARALEAFDAYSRQGGALQPEALAGKIRALRALGRTEEERRAIQRYLELYPNGFEAVALEKRLALLSR